MASHVIDNLLLQNSFGTDEMRMIWDEKNRLQKQLDVERALAEAEGELEVIPQEAAAVIASVADRRRFDLQELAQAGLTSKHSLIATIKKLQELAGTAGEFVHYGATTQDIVDTGTVLQLREAHQIIRRDLKKLLYKMTSAAAQYKTLPMAGRTHGVQALPITFGFKLSVIVCELGRHLERLEELEHRVFAGVLCGAVGTYASFDGRGNEIEANVMKKLGLAVPEICWHASRDRFAEYASVLSLLSATLGKLGHEFQCSPYSYVNLKDKKCPVCSGKQVKEGFNDLNSIYPDLALQWNYKKNHINPENVNANSNKKYWWKCDKGHEWEASVISRNRGTSCPFCSNRRVLKGFNDLQTTCPELMQEWNYEKNDILPSTITEKSSKKVWWKCNKCGYEWCVAPACRNKKQGRSGCPACAGNVVKTGVNDLQTLYPEIAARWDYEMNGDLSPSKVAPKSEKVIWWKCEKGHSYKRTISHETRGYKCPICKSKNKVL